MSDTTKAPAVAAGASQASAVSEAGSPVRDGSTVPQAIASVEQLVVWERQVRDIMDHHRAELEDFAAWRARIVQCLHNVHRMSYQDIADRLGDVTASRVQQIARGKAR